MKFKTECCRPGDPIIMMIKKYCDDNYYVHNLWILPSGHHIITFCKVDYKAVLTPNA